MLQANWHTYQVLTKRSDRMQQMLTTKLQAAAQSPHIWWGVSVEDKKYGVPRIDHLQHTPANVRFLSIEPLLEDLGGLNLAGIHWVIVGGESGPGARSMQPSWVTKIQNQCESSRTFFFFKQWGGVQKAKRGRNLNGKTYDAMPALSTQAPPRAADRQNLIGQFARLISQWDNQPLVQLTHRASVA